MCRTISPVHTVGLAILAFTMYLLFMMTYMEPLEFALRWMIGLQMAFWGLNGFFHWKQIPPSAPAIDNFTQACLQAGFIMPTVKLLEIICGLFLIFNVATPLAIALLAPIFFVVSGLHLLYNKRSWEVILPLTLPYLGLAAIHYQSWLKLLDY